MLCPPYSENTSCVLNETMCCVLSIVNMLLRHRSSRAVAMSSTEEPTTAATEDAAPFHPETRQASGPPATSPERMSAQTTNNSHIYVISSRGDHYPAVDSREIVMSSADGTIDANNHSVTSSSDVIIGDGSDVESHAPVGPCDISQCAPSSTSEREQLWARERIET